MVNGLKRQMGIWLMLTGVLHSVVGLLLFPSSLKPLVTEGLWSTIHHGQLDRGNSFWFMWFGFLLILLGYLTDWLMREKGLAPPPALGWTLFVLCLAGAIVIPVSGFWLGLPQAWILMRKS